MVVGFTTTYSTSVITTNVQTPLRWGVLDTTSCDKVCQWLTAGQRFSPCTAVSSTNKTESKDTTEILLKVALNTTTQTKPFTKDNSMELDGWVGTLCIFVYTNSGIESTIKKSLLYWMGGGEKILLIPHHPHLQYFWNCHQLHVLVFATDI